MENQVIYNYKQPTADNFVIELDASFFSTNALRAESLGGTRLVLRQIYPAQKRIDGVYCTFELQTMNRKGQSEYSLYDVYDPKKGLFEQYTDLLASTVCVSPEPKIVVEGNSNDDLTCNAASSSPGSSNTIDDVAPAEAEASSTSFIPRKREYPTAELPTYSVMW